MRQDVEFSTEDGTTLRGILHARDVAAPGVVIAHGFSGVKEQIDPYAAVFAPGGFTVLAYDHRGFGASDGSPRLEVDADRQLADWRDALTFMGGRAEVDTAAGFGVWGSSFAGGLAMMLAATDNRVRCVVSQIPHVSGRRNGREMFNAAQRAELRDAFAADRAGRSAGAPPRRIPVFSADPSEMCALPPAMSAKHIRMAEERTPSWRNEVTLRSVETMLNVEPAGWAPYVAPTPFLMIVGAQDTYTFTEHQLEVFEQARQPKRLVVHPGGHFDTYTDHFERTSGEALTWFREHLPPTAPTLESGARDVRATRHEHA